MLGVEEEATGKGNEEKLENQQEKVVWEKKKNSIMKPSILYVNKNLKFLSFCMC